MDWSDWRETIMLILGRREGEATVIDGQIIVKVVDIRGNRVVLGFEAPPDVGIRRGELTEAGWSVSDRVRSARSTAAELADEGSEPGAIEDRQALVPSNDQIAAIIQEEVQSAGGSIPSLEEARGDLFVRALLPRQAEVRPGDQVVGGLAVRAAGNQIEIRHYLLRLACTNGSIADQQIYTCCVSRVAADSGPDVIGAAVARLRAAVWACFDRPVFEAVIASLRRSQHQAADLAVFRRWAAPRLPVSRSAELHKAILRRFRQERDRSLFSLMNAVTSLARDERDPALRWRLEELGGGVPSLQGLRKPPGADRPQAVWRELVKAK